MSSDYGYGFKCYILLICVDSLCFLINCDLGSEVEIVRNLTEIPELKKVRNPYGVYNIFIKAQAGSIVDLEDNARNKMKRISKFCPTATLSPMMFQGGCWTRHDHSV